MEMNFTQYYIPIVVFACLIVGYCIKHIKWLDAVSNDYIPTILAVLGAILGCLASTGPHQMFTRLIESGDKQ